MNNKLLFPDFENIIVAGEIPTAIENGYTYLEQVMALRKYVLSLGKYTKDLTTNVNNNTDDITKLKAFKHITHLGTKEGDIFKLEELKDDLYYADYNIFIQYKTGFLAYFKKGALITKSSGISENEEYNKLENVLQHQATGYIDGTITTTYNVYNSVTKEILDANTSSINISELNTKLDNHSNEISNLQTKVIELTNSITTINGILENTSHIKHISENANLWELNVGIYKATTNLNIKISTDASVTDEPFRAGQIFMVQTSNNDEWEMWYTALTNIMYAQTLKENDVYTGSRKSINVSNITSKIENLENRVTNLEKAPKDQSIIIEFNEGTDTIIPKLQVFVDNFRKGIVTPIYWYYTSGDLLQLSKIVNGLNNPNKGMNLYFTAFEATTLTNKQIPVGYILINVDLTTYNITNINKNWEYQTIESGSSDLPIASKTTLGGVKIGNGIDVTSDGTISADTNIPVNSFITKTDLKKIYDAYTSGKNYNVYNTYEEFSMDAGFSITSISAMNNVLDVTFMKNSGKYATALTYSYNNETDTITSEDRKDYTYVTGDSDAFAVKKIQTETGQTINSDLALSLIDPNTHKSNVYNFLHNILQYSQYKYNISSTGDTLLVSNYNIVDYGATSTTPQIYKLISVNGEFTPNGNLWDVTDVFTFINKDLSYNNETKDKYNVIEYKMKSISHVGKDTNNIFYTSVFTENSEITLKQYNYYISKTEN